jgi:hypothetical protein
MSFGPFIEIVRPARVQRAVAAFRNVNVKRHNLRWQLFFEDTENAINRLLSGDIGMFQKHFFTGGFEHFVIFGREFRKSDAISLKFLSGELF